MYKKAALDDCKAVYALICELENKQLPYDDFAAVYREQVEDAHYYCLVCEQDGAIVGVLNLRFEGQLHHSEHIAEVMEFVIAADHRDKGLGKEMFTYACQLAKEHGCAQIELASNQLRKDSHRFYQREGMHNFHYKFSKRLVGPDVTENAIGR